MTFSIIDVVKEGASASSLIKDPAAPYLTEIQQLAGSSTEFTGDVGGIKTALQGLGPLSGIISSYVSQELENLKTKLPILAASSRLEKAADAASGRISTDSPTALFAQATEGIHTLQDKLESIKTSITSALESAASSLTDVAGSTTLEKMKNFSNQAPSATIPDPGNPSQSIPNPAYATFLSSNPEKVGGLTASASSLSSTVAGATSDFQGVASRESAALSQSTAKLKDFAFAKFVTQNKPPEVQALIAKFTNPPTAANFVEEQTLSQQDSLRRQANAASAPAANVAQSVEFATYGPSGNAPAPQVPVAEVVSTPPVDRKGKIVLSSERMQEWAEHIKTYRRTVMEPWWDSQGLTAYYRAVIADPSNKETLSAWEQASASLKDTEPHKSYVESREALRSVWSQVTKTIVSHNQNLWNPLYSVTLTQIEREDPTRMEGGQPKKMSFWVAG